MSLLRVAAMNPFQGKEPADKLTFQPPHTLDSVGTGFIVHVVCVRYVSSIIVVRCRFLLRKIYQEATEHP